MLALSGAAILPADSPALPQGVVLVDNGKITAVGARVEIPADCAVLDVRGKVITPGLIDSHTHLGVYSESLAWSGEDVNEHSQAITPGLHVLDALYPRDIGLADACAGGITTVMVAPGSSNPSGGQCAIIKTRPKMAVEEMLLTRYAGLKIAFGENPRHAFGDSKKMPVTRMATAAMLRELLVKGQEYAARQGEKDHKFDLGLEAVGRVLCGKMPLRAHAHRADDILTALRIADEFQTDIIIEHATEAHLIADLLAARQAKLVLGPFMITRVKLELKDRSWQTPAIMHQHGVPFALMSDHPVMPSCFLPVYAGLAARYGLDEEAALRSITLDAARILDIADRVGSLTAGKDADLVVWSGSPLLLASRAELVMIDGAVGMVDSQHGEPAISEWQE